MREFMRHRYVLFTAARYLGYILLFIRGLVIASVLGPAALGVWGFLTLLIEYLGYTNMGVQYAINVELSVRGRNDDGYARHVINNAFGVLIILAVLLQSAAILIIWSKIEIFPEYNTLSVMLHITVIASLMHGYSVFLNIFRAYEKLSEVMIAELSVTLVTMVAALFLPAPMLINGLLWAMIVGYTFSLILFGIRSPIHIRPEFSFVKMKPLISQGASLLIYNLSFYLMTMVARSTIGFFYQVEEMGFFTLANSLASAIMLGINSILWVIYPKILFIFRPEVPVVIVVDAMDEITFVLQKLVYGIVLLAAAISPLILLILPQYSSIFPTLYFLLLTQALLLGSGASNSLAVARGKEKAVAKIGLLIVAIMLLVLTVVVTVGGPAFVVSIALMVTAGIYTLMMNRYAYNLLGVEQAFLRAYRLTFTVGDFIPAFATAIIALTSFSYIAGATGLILYILMNATKFPKLLDKIHEISTRSNVVQTAV